ncbi:MAG: aspartate-semialdehyde dehydrogenase [Deltaproteobacteria bacterium]|nr:aspartate-semialdehyde dehydrogenase [Deltaproteobacteria bacterium]
MAKSFKVAVVGATGLVGREMLAVLEERGFPVSSLVPLASERSAGEKLRFAGDELTVQKASAASFAGVEIVLMSAGGAASRELAPLAAKAGAVVIDNSSAWRMDDAVPLVVPEVNPADVGLYKGRGIIANPNCSTIQMVVALNPLHQAAGLKRVVVATYQAVSGKGKRAMDELSSQVTALFSQREAQVEVFPKRIAFNCVPHIDVFLEDGFTKEEHKMLFETRKIMHLPAVGVVATCVRVPVFNGHAEAVVAEFERPLSPAAARDLLTKAPGVMLMDDPNETLYPTQLDVDGSDATFVGRIRQDSSAPNSLAFWCVADNLRKGAASNAVQIAELLARDHLTQR